MSPSGQHLCTWCDGLNDVSQSHALKSQALGPQNVALFGSRVLADVTSKDEVTLEKHEPLLQYRENLDSNIHTGRTPYDKDGQQSTRR